ncbi:MAG: tetratricopeptide repeat protein, partial [Chloroflexi bacterium]|nr:tetratricopeptide repeat protein [Chloroflexota bacterium]
MTKRKKRKKTQRAPRAERPIPSRLLEGLHEAERLTKKKRWAEARDLLLDLDRRYPRRPEVLTHLVNACFELHDTEGYQYACERLVKADPNNGDAALGLAGAHLEGLRPVLALRAFRHFLERWPDHKRASEVRGTVADLEAKMPALLKDLGISSESENDASWQLAIQHEEMQVHLAQGRFRQVQQTAQAILQRYPEFAPALNNLSIAHWADGQTDQAIQAAQQVLTFEPENVHA